MRVGAGRKCSICSHPRRSEIDVMMGTGVAISRVCAEFGLSPDAAQRHRKQHLAASASFQVQQLPPERQRAIAESAPDIAELLQKRLADAERLGQIAENDRNIAVALDAIRTWVGVFKLQAQIYGDLSPDTTVNNIQINNTLIVEGLCRDILEVLRPYPEARKALADFMSTRQTL